MAVRFSTCPWGLPPQIYNFLALILSALYLDVQVISKQPALEGAQDAKMVRT
jgi:hypothetical protein